MPRKEPKKDITDEGLIAITTERLARGESVTVCSIQRAYRVGEARAYKCLTAARNVAYQQAFSLMKPTHVEPITNKGKWR